MPETVFSILILISSDKLLKKSFAIQVWLIIHVSLLLSHFLYYNWYLSLKSLFNSLSIDTIFVMVMQIVESTLRLVLSESQKLNTCNSIVAAYCSESLGDENNGIFPAAQH